MGQTVVWCWLICLCYVTTLIVDLWYGKNKKMTTTNNKLEQKIKADFIAYFGNEPKEIKIENEYAYVDGFYCRILNNKSIKKTHGIAWRRDN